MSLWLQASHGDQPRPMTYCWVLSHSSSNHCHCQYPVGLFPTPLVAYSFHCPIANRMWGQGQEISHRLGSASKCFREPNVFDEEGRTLHKSPCVDKNDKV